MHGSGPDFLWLLCLIHSLVVTGRVAATTIVEVWTPDEWLSPLIALQPSGETTYHNIKTWYARSSVPESSCLPLRGLRMIHTEFSAPKMVKRDLGES